MAIDVFRIIGASTRAISSREIDGQLARVLVASRVYDTDQADLWDAMTSIEPVSYTHLDVYKRQGPASGRRAAR